MVNNGGIKRRNWQGKTLKNKHPIVRIRLGWFHKYQNELFKPVSLPNCQHQGVPLEDLLVYHGNSILGDKAVVCCILKNLLNKLKKQILFKDIL